MNYFILIPVLMLFTIGIFYNKEYKEFFNRFIGNKPDYLDYIGGKNNITYKYKNLKYELEKTRLLYSIIFILIVISLLILYYNQKSLYDKTTLALSKKGVIDFINGTYIFDRGF